MKRLLCIVSSMDRGGAETFLMKLYRSLDTSKYQMDFCVSNPKKGFYDDEIKAKGGKIFLIPQKSKNPIKSFAALKKIVKENEYKYVLRTSQQSLATLDLIAAKMGGAKKLIYRSSNANTTGGFAKKALNKLFSFLPRIVPNVKIAPSTEAAEFVFGKRAVRKGKVVLLHNGLDYEQFRFNNSIREKIRAELEVENKILFGHVGRFNIQKNHSFLIEIFEEIHKENTKAQLILIGEGELKESIENKINELNLQECVKILGAKPNVNEYLMAMDALIFPSFFEGMPNVIIEAQATGLPAVLSNTITPEADITGLLTYLDLNTSKSVWAKEALNKTNIERKDYEKEFIENGYNIKNILDEYVNVLF